MAQEGVRKGAVVAATKRDKRYSAAVRGTVRCFAANCQLVICCTLLALHVAFCVALTIVVHIIETRGYTSCVCMYLNLT